MGITIVQLTASLCQRQKPCLKKNIPLSASYNLILHQPSNIHEVVVSQSPNNCVIVHQSAHTVELLQCSRHNTIAMTQRYERTITSIKTHLSQSLEQEAQLSPRDHASEAYLYKWIICSWTRARIRERCYFCVCQCGYGSGVTQGHWNLYHSIAFGNN